MNRAKQMRLRMGWSQADLAKFTGLNESTISRFERGTAQHATVATALVVAKALSTTVEEMFSVGKD